MVARLASTARPLMSRPDRHLEGVGGPAGLLRRQDVAQGHHLAVGVGHLHPDGLAARDGGQDAHVGRGHGVGDVLVQAGHPGHLHPRTQLQLVAGDGGTDHHAHQARLHAVLGQGRLQGPAPVLHGLAVHLLGVGAVQQLGRAAASTPAPGRRAQVDLELAAGAGPPSTGRRGRRTPGRPGARPVSGSEVGRVRLVVGHSTAGFVAGHVAPSAGTRVRRARSMAIGRAVRLEPVSSSDSSGGVAHLEQGAQGPTQRHRSPAEPRRRCGRRRPAPRCGSPAGRRSRPPPPPRHRRPRARPGGPASHRPGCRGHHRREPD